MKKLWAIICVVGYTAFWAFGLIAVLGFFSDRPNSAITYILCAAGFGIGTYARLQVVAMTPKMHGRRAEARDRLEEEYNKQSHG